MRRADHAYDDCEFEEGVRGIAVPVRDYTGNIVACLSVGGPAARMGDSLIAERLPQLADAAARISFALGWQARAT